jgi:hypothetical protein
VESEGQYDCQGRKRCQHHPAFVEDAAEGRQRTHIQPQEQIELAQGALILRQVKAGKRGEEVAESYWEKLPPRYTSC